MSDRDSGRQGRSKTASRAEAPFGAFVRKPVARRDVGVDAAQAQAIGSSASDAAAQSWPEDAVEVGAVVDAYGLKGWVKVAAHANAGQGGDALLKAKRWWLVKGDERKTVSMAQSKVHGDSIVAQLSGSDDRDRALALRGYRVYVRRSDFPTLGADEFYWVDLVGLEVVNEAGVALGRVAELIDNGAHAVLNVAYPTLGKDGQPTTGERLIPFVGVYVKTVDQAAKRIVVDWEADY